MNCKDVEQLLFLYREDELDNTEKKAVKAHISKCESCAGLLVELESMDTAISGLRLNTPVHPDPDALRRQIMTAVGSRRLQGSNTGQQGKFFTLRDRLAVPGVRYAMTFIVVLILSVFTIQEFFILHKISALEARLEMKQVQPVRSLPASRSNENGELSLSGMDVDLLAQWMVIRKSRLQSLIHELETLEAENAVLRRVLEQRYPELVEMLDSRGISQQELDRLLNSRDELLHALQKL